MDINIKQELVFKIETNEQTKNKKVSRKKVIRMAEENLTKMMMDRLDQRTGEC